MPVSSIEIDSRMIGASTLYGACLVEINKLKPSKPGDNHVWKVSGNLQKSIPRDEIELRLVADCQRCRFQLHFISTISADYLNKHQNIDTSLNLAYTDLTKSIRNYIISPDGKANGGCEDTQRLRLTNDVINS